LKIRLNVDGLYATENMLKSPASRATKMRPAMDVIMTRMLGHEFEVFNTSGGNVGREWEPTESGKGVGDILVGSGRLMRSLTIPHGPESIQIVTDSDIRYGSKVPYFGFHDRGTRYIPKRPPIMFSAVNAREYYRIMQNYLFHGVPDDHVR
jgi:phage gpG-like protein